MFVPQTIERIVCLTEEPTEIIYELGCAERIVGISAYTVRPPQARRQKPVVSAFIDGSVRKIAALKPDLVIGFSDVQAKLAHDLIKENLPVLIFNQRSINEILGVIDTLGKLLGKHVQATSLIARLVDNLEATRRRHAKSPRPRVYFEEWPDPAICGIAWVSELIDIAGGINVFAAESHGKKAAERHVSYERICAARPDVIVASWCGKAVERESFAARPGFADLEAVRLGRIYEIDSSLILQPGPACLSDGLRALEAALHGPKARGATP